MIQFFRKIRQKLLLEGNTIKYLKYAIGEIILVVIGILIALQINTWNEVKKHQAREIVLLKELKSNLKTNILNLEKDIKTQTEGMQYFNIIMDHADHKRPYNDSLPSYLQKANFAPDVVLTASAFETMKSSGLNIIRSDSLRQGIINLFELVYPTLMQETRRLEDQLWPALVMPLYQKHFRNINNKWIPNDYENWLADTEFFNMLSFRGALRIQSTVRKTKVAAQTAEVIRMIEIELKQRKVE